MNRRQFIQASSLASLATATGAGGRPGATELGGTVHVFSKHLQFLDYDAMAAAAATIGFDGVDLTIRPGGHVEPVQVGRDLPRAVAALRSHGLAPIMCTTNIDRMDRPEATAVLDRIAEAGFRHLRLGYFRFAANRHPADQIESLRPVVQSLAKALARRGLNGALQNHAGERYVGSSLWEYFLLLQDVDPATLGIQFDIRHATAERGASWRQELATAAPHISSLVMKDMDWIEDATTGRPHLHNTPLGEGWVDFPRYFHLLGQHGIDVPVSLHLEYDLGGANHGDRELTVPPATVFAAMRRDLTTLRSYQRGSFSASKT